MNIKLQIPLIFRNLLSLILLLGFGSSIHSQELFVGSNALFYLSKDSDFTTSNSLVEVAENGTFAIEAGSNWGSATEYVNGEVTALGTGMSILPVGDNGVFAPVTMDHSTDATARYFNSAPTSGSNGADVVAVSDVEYWELTGTAVVTLPWNENSDITSLVNTNGGVFNAISIVGLNGGDWNLISESNSFTLSGDLLNGTVTSDLNNPVNLDGYGEFTFGIDNQIVLSTDDLFFSSGINLLSNPVRVGDDIRFTISGDIIDLDVSIYDINGRLVRHFERVNPLFGEGSLPKSSLKGGLYFIKFEHEGKQGVKKIIIE